MEKNKLPDVRFPSFHRNWKHSQLRELCDEFRSGKSINAKDILDKGRYPVLGGNGLRGYTSNYTHKGKYALIGRQGALCGNMNISNGKAYFTEHAIAVKANENNDTGFLFYLLGKMNLGQYSGQSAQPGLAVNKLIELTTYVPTREEQIQISTYFETLDDTILLQEQELATLKQTKQGFLQKMFPKEGEFVPELRLPGFPENWKTFMLSDVATFINGRAYKQQELLNSGKYKVLRVGNFYTNNTWYYSDLDLGEKYYADSGDLLYTWSASFGPHIWQGGKVIYHYHIWKVELKRNFDKQFTVQLLEYDKAKILNDKNGSTLVHITKKGMEEKKVLLPSFKEQIQIGNFFKQLDELIAIQKQELEALKQTKKAFLQKMFV